MRASSPVFAWENSGLRFWRVCLARTDAQRGRRPAIPGRAAALAPQPGGLTFRCMRLIALRQGHGNLLPRQTGVGIRCRQLTRPNLRCGRPHCHRQRHAISCRGSASVAVSSHTRPSLHASHCASARARQSLAAADWRRRRAQDVFSPGMLSCQTIFFSRDKDAMTYNSGQPSTV